MKPEIAKKILEKVKDNYSKIAHHFSETRYAPWKEMEEFGEFIGDGDKILDLGCGNGRLYEVFQGMSIDYAGVDNSPELIGFARKRWGEDERRRFLVGDVTNLDWWKGKKYNVVFLIAILHHVPGKSLRKKVLENAAKILEKDGLLITINWDLFQIKYFPFIAKNIFLKIFGQSEMDFRDAMIPWREPQTRKVLARRYVHAFTLRELARLVKESGFEILENFYSNRGERIPWWHGRNIVTIAKRE